jgi:hypothetical protein
MIEKEFTMSDIVQITEIEVLQKTIKYRCSAVFVQARFGGASERWVKITKAEAIDLIEGISGTPEENEMYTDKFGEFHPDGSLYLG